jgi:hypothetical protein
MAVPARYEIYPSENIRAKGALIQVDTFCLAEIR